MGYRYTKDDILNGAVAFAFDEGLSQLTFGRLAKRLGTSDRIIVYYFPTKRELIAGVLLALGSALAAELSASLVEPVSDHRTLVRRVWPLVARPATDPVFALFFEAAGLASARHEPYRTVVPTLVDGWIDWAAALLTGPASRRRQEAASAVAVIDGLLLLRQLAGARAANAAARQITEP